MLAMLIALCGCGRSAEQMAEIRAVAFPEGKPIPLKVAVIYNGVYIHKGLDTNHDMGKLSYAFTVNAGSVLEGLLKKRMPKMFSEVVFIPDISMLKPGYLPLTPRNISIKTANEKLSNNFRCGSTTYGITGSATISLLLSNAQGIPIVEYTATDTRRMEDSWNAYCLGMRQIGGAHDLDYKELVESAIENAMLRLERDIRGSGTIVRYTELQASLPADVLAERWAHSVVLEGHAPNPNEIKVQGEPVATLASIVQARIDDYLAPRSADRIKLNIPAPVELPTVPPPPGMVAEEDMKSTRLPEPDQDDDEVKGSAVLFPEKREFRLQKLQGQFRNAVENRNQFLTEIKSDYLKELGTINNEQEAKRLLVDQKYLELVREDWLNVIGGVSVKSLSYDAAAGQLRATLKSNRSSYELRAAFAMGASEAAALLGDEANLVPVVEFSNELKGLSIRDIRLYHNGRPYVAAVSDENRRLLALGIQFNIKSLAFTSADAAAFTLQDPNLLDSYHIKTIAPGYADDMPASGFAEDLIEPLRLAEPRAASPQRWLVAIGIENYKSADRVLFGVRSYTLFVDAAQKLLGIPRDHVIGLLDAQATTEGIAAMMASLPQRLREGDTVYFYYGGHIIRDPARDRIYLLPVEAMPDVALAEGRFRLESLMEALMATRPARVIAFIDAGVGGKTDGVPVVKGVQRTPALKLDLASDASRLTLITASKSEQSSNVFYEKRHRMFTYYLIRDLAAGGARRDLDGFIKKLQDDVREASFKKKDIYRQDPQVYGTTQGRL